MNKYEIAKKIADKFYEIERLRAEYNLSIVETNPNGMISTVNEFQYRFISEFQSRYFSEIDSIDICPIGTYGVWFFNDFFFDFTKILEILQTDKTWEQVSDEYYKELKN